LIGPFLRPLREVEYHRLDDGQVEGYAHLEQGSDLTLRPGEAGIVLPLDMGIHQTGAAGDPLTFDHLPWGVREKHPAGVHPIF